MEFLLNFHGVVMDIFCNYTIDVNFSCICAVIINIICHNIVSVVDHSYFDNVMTKFMINKTTEGWKTYICSYSYGITFLDKYSSTGVF